MTTYPCAKINLGLCVTQRRQDGYHNLETVFYPIPLRDVLHVEERDIFDSLIVDGLDVNGDPDDNLVFKALHMLRDEGYDVPTVRIKLTKKIPPEAGLGGGSSDAAHLVVMMNEMMGLGMTSERMRELVAQLGADCAFFVDSKPTFAEGIGNIFSPVSVDLKGWFLVLVKPKDRVSTREAYAKVVPAKPAYDLRKAIALPVEEWRGKVVNDFEKSVFPQHPTIANIKEDLYAKGAVYASMSGSGSSVYGLFREPIDYHSEHFVFSAFL